MGIPGLLPALKSIFDNVHISRYRGQKVGIDAYAWLHRGAYHCSTELCLGIQSEKYIEFCVSRLNLLLQNGVKPVLVFDGAPLPEKLKTEKRRAEERQKNRAKGLSLYKAGNTDAAYKCFQKAVDITPYLAHRLIERCRTINGVEWLVAPYEADAQLAYLSQKGLVQAVISEDSDLIPFGCKRVMYKLEKDGKGQEFRLKNLGAVDDMSFANWDQNMIQFMCILSGCDYLDSIKGVGIKGAHGLIHTYKTYTKAIQRMRLEGKHKVPAGYESDFAKAYLTFQHQRVFCPLAKRLVHLNPVPADVAAAYPDLDFLGADIDPELAQGIADGVVDPGTRQPFVQATPAAGAGAGAGANAAAAAGAKSSDVKSDVPPEVLAKFLASSSAASLHGTSKRKTAAVSFINTAPIESFFQKSTDAPTRSALPARTQSDSAVARPPLLTLKAKPIAAPTAPASSGAGASRDPIMVGDDDVDADAVADEPKPIPTRAPSRLRPGGAMLSVKRKTVSDSAAAGALTSKSPGKSLNPFTQFMFGSPSISVGADTSALHQTVAASLSSVPSAIDDTESRPSFAASVSRSDSLPNPISGKARAPSKYFGSSVSTAPPAAPHTNVMSRLQTLVAAPVTVSAANPAPATDSEPPLKRQRTVSVRSPPAQPSTAEHADDCEKENHPQPIGRPPNDTLSTDDSASVVPPVPLKAVKPTKTELLLASNMRTQMSQCVRKGSRITLPRTAPISTAALFDPNTSMIGRFVGVSKASQPPPAKALAPVPPRKSPAVSGVDIEVMPPPEEGDAVARRSAVARTSMAPFNYPTSVRGPMTTAAQNFERAFSPPTPVGRSPMTDSPASTPSPATVFSPGQSPAPSPSLARIATPSPDPTNRRVQFVMPPRSSPAIPSPSPPLAAAMDGGSSEFEHSSLNFDDPIDTSDAVDASAGVDGGDCDLPYNDLPEPHPVPFVGHRRASAGLPPATEVPSPPAESPLSPPPSTIFQTTSRGARFKITRTEPVRASLPTLSTSAAAPVRRPSDGGAYRSMVPFPNIPTDD